jgi:Zn-dependent peptidase ImmA (M78 family)
MRCDSPGGSDTSQGRYTVVPCWLATRLSATDLRGLEWSLVPRHSDESRTLVPWVPRASDSLSCRKPDTQGRSAGNREGKRARTAAQGLDGLVMDFGAGDELAISLQWPETTDSASAASATRGRLRLSIGGAPIWHDSEVAGGIEWTWIELLEFLSHVWPWLTWEEGFPFGLRGGPLQALRLDLQRRWNNVALVIREEEEAHVYDFQESHDLARAIPGLILPSVWFVREGHNCWVASEDSAVLIRLASALSTLNSLGEAIADRLSEVDDRRSRSAKQDWQGRMTVPVAQKLMIATGLSDEQRLEIEGGEDPRTFWEVVTDTFDVNEVMAAARMVAALPAPDVRAIVDAVRATPRRATEGLDRLAEAALLGMPVGPEWPAYDQGYHVAGWLRHELGVASSQRIDPQELLEGWGVAVYDVTTTASTIDAVAAWGPRHGPAVFVNTNGAHSRSPAGRRATLAHELGHLLIDRSDSLPLAEVLGGRAAPTAEVRARAFAAELLLPRETAGHEVSTAPDDPDLVVTRLQEAFGVSREVIAWQARNSDVELPARARSLLRTFVSQPFLY